MHVNGDGVKLTRAFVYIQSKQLSLKSQKVVMKCTLTTNISHSWSQLVTPFPRICCTWSLSLVVLSLLSNLFNQMTKCCARQMAGNWSLRWKTRKLDCHNFATMHSCTQSKKCMAMIQLYILLIDCGRPVYY